VKPTPFKVLILFLVLASAMTLAGWTWDEGAVLPLIAQHTL
jgi:hypothetical protein